MELSIFCLSARNRGVPVLDAGVNRLTHQLQYMRSGTTQHGKAIDQPGRGIQKTPHASYVCARRHLGCPMNALPIPLFSGLGSRAAFRRWFNQRAQPRHSCSLFAMQARAVDTIAKVDVAKLSDDALLVWGAPRWVRSGTFVASFADVPHRRAHRGLAMRGR